MSRTINGKSLKEVFEELRTPLDERLIKKRFDGFFYFDIDAYRAKLESVVGVDHFNEMYDAAKVEKLEESYVIHSRCVLEFLDDNYEVICRKSACGATNVEFPKDKDTNERLTTSSTIYNDIYNSNVDAFKRICKNQFHIGEEQIAAKNAGTLYTGSVSNFKGTDKGHYFGTITLEDGKKVNLAVFKNSAESFIAAYTDKPSKISFYGDMGQDKRGNDQIVFSKPYVAGASSTVPVPSVSTDTSKPQNDDSAQAPVLTVTTVGTLTDDGAGGYYVNAQKETDNSVIRIHMPESSVKTIAKETFEQFKERVNTKGSTFSFTGSKAKLSGEIVYTFYAFAKKSA